MTPEQLQYVREWAKDGNLARNYASIPSWCLHVTTRGESAVERHLDIFAMTIARMADALEQANETVDYLRTFGSNRTSAEGNQLLVDVHTNRLELLGR